ncbi:uncharacterized protein LDX57_008560 [Aspergillus melleus]|uniref:uncharacterized protein n=1 Tax=Aspergillus melleus TaxID=138277 RepID=UPI001E8E73BE|nr:uncharacterized protein LDX57_008560 [Aspergillus melleus]KAH8430896.1 hypothetical protein LDX57_008560 [Aspergillus melleus]
MFGQSSLFEDMVPTLDRRYNVTLISDIFFGTADGPATLRNWAAHLWSERHGVPPSSLIVVDTRPHQPGTPLFRDAQERQESEQAALRRFGTGETRMIEEHFGKHDRVWSQSSCPPVYHGPSLFPAHAPVPGGRHGRWVASPLSTH